LGEWVVVLDDGNWVSGSWCWTREIGWMGRGAGRGKLGEWIVVLDEGNWLSGSWCRITGRRILRD